MANGALVSILYLVITDTHILYQMVFILAGVYVSCYKMDDSLFSSFCRRLNTLCWIHCSLPGGCCFDVFQLSLCSEAAMQRRLKVEFHFSLVSFFTC